MMFIKLFLVVITFGLFGCQSDPGEDLQNSLNTPEVSNTAKAIFSPADSVIPFPSDLLFTGTTDGTLNIPVDPLNPADAPKIK